jgi:hypothetical protein
VVDPASIGFSAERLNQIGAPARIRRQHSLNLGPSTVQISRANSFSMTDPAQRVLTDSEPSTAALAPCRWRLAAFGWRILRVQKTVDRTIAKANVITATTKRPA